MYFSYRNQQEQKPLRKGTEKILREADTAWFQSQSATLYKQSVCMFFSYSNDESLTFKS